MSSAAKKILESALGLPPEERERIVVELAASLNGRFTGKEIEATWLAEIDRRWKEVESGKAVLHDWADLRDQILAELRGP
jgi:putative addiction module component (TIGR02574 family)